MKYKFTEFDYWETEISLPYDPIGNGKMKIVVETDGDPSERMSGFLDEVVTRYEELWKKHSDSLLAQGFTLDELKKAHQTTELCCGDFTQMPPEEWAIEYMMDFVDGPEISYGLQFSGWQTDGHFTGCH